MRKLLPSISFVTILLVAIGLFAVPHSAHAEGGILSGIFNIADLGSAALNRIILWPFEFFVLPLAAGMMALAGLMMDTAINFSLHTAYLVSLSPAINLGWSVVRDIANMFFIFIMLYIGIGTIIQGAKFQTKQLLTQIVIAALLINFSLFITQAVVDVSNVFGNWLYAGVQNSLNANSTNGQGSLSALITTRLGIANFWSSATTNTSDTDKTMAEQIKDPTKNFIGVFLRLALVSIAIYIFAYCAILFIARSIELLFLMVFAPIGFMGGILPQVKSYANEWRSELTKVAIFPIAFLLLLYVSVQFINSLGFLSTAALTDKSVSIFGFGFSVSQYFQYFLIIFLLKGTLDISKKYSGEMGTKLGGMADALGKLAVNAIGTYATGGAALGMRALGRGAGAALGAESGKRGEAFGKAFKENLPPILTSPQIGKYIKDPSKIARDTQKAAANAMKSGTWDVRNIPVGGGLTLGGAIGTATGANLGSKDAKAIKAEQAEWSAERKIEKSIDDTLKDIREIEAENVNYTTAAASGASAQQLQAIQTRINNAEDRVRKTLNKASNEDVTKMAEALHEQEGNDAVLAHFVNRLKPQQADSIAENKEISDKAKKRVNDGRISDFNSSLLIQPAGSAGRKTAITGALGKLSGKEVAKIGIQKLSDPDVIDALKISQMKQIMEEYSYSDRSAIRGYIMTKGQTNNQDPVFKWLGTPDGQSF